jgi:hypothetical protein
VPKKLRAAVGQSELSVALGPDKRQALRKLPAAVARFQEQIAEAERSRASAGASKPPVSFEPVQAARALYDRSLAFDSELRDHTPLYAQIGFPDADYVRSLREIIAGRLEEREMPQLFLMKVKQHVPPDLDQATWRRASRILAQAELAALEVNALRDEGEQDPPLPKFLEATAMPMAATSTISIRAVFDGYRVELERIGKGRRAEVRWSPIIES